MSKKTKVLSGLFSLCLALSGASAFAHPPTVSPWRLTFQDNFRYPKLNRTRWTTTYHAAYPHGVHTNVGNHEMQWYVEDAFRFRPGVLRIEAKRHPNVAPGYDYQSGLISTRESFTQKYGYFEARVKVPKGSGTWPAFWMLPAKQALTPAPPELPEIDIMETFGPKLTMAFQTYFYPVDNVQTKTMNITKLADYSKKFHIYGVYWTADVIRWYVDNQPVFETKTGVSQVPMYMLLNLALNQDARQNDALKVGKPSYYLVDYVRAYAIKAKP